MIDRVYITELSIVRGEKMHNKSKFSFVGMRNAALIQRCIFVPLIFKRWWRLFKNKLKLTGIGNGDPGRALSALGSVGLDLLDDVHALDDLTEDNVLAVQPGGLGRADKELRTVGVGSGVGHG